jgi:mono/diheme cytochrome c family protein
MFLMSIIAVSSTGYCNGAAMRQLPRAARIPQVAIERWGNFPAGAEKRRTPSSATSCGLPQAPEFSPDAGNAGSAAPGIAHGVGLGMPLRSGLLVLLAALCFARPSGGQTTGTKNPTLVISSMYGRDLFELYCATCHGSDGKGNGPAADALKVRPADLTTIARRNGGTFPKSRIEAFVTVGDERATPAHGSSEMPVWGPIFRALDPNDAANKVRLANIVEYLGSLQVK